MEVVSLYEDAEEEKKSQEPPLSEAEAKQLDDLNAIFLLQAQPGWKKLLIILEKQKALLIHDITYAENPIEISRLQGALHALNLFFGTADGLIPERAFLSQVQARTRGEPKE